MNERVKQIKDKAYSQLPYAEFVSDRFVEKFTELIVEECIDYCGENLSKTVAGALKIHLGVE